MKFKIASIFLLCSLIAPALLTFSWLQYKEVAIKEEVKRKLLNSSFRDALVLFKLTEEESITQLHWKDSEEFEYKGEMYDVIEKTINGDTTFYWCWWDHEESSLKKQMNELVANILGNDPANKNTNKRLSVFFNSLFHSPLPQHSIIQPKSDPIYAVYSFDYLSVFISPPAPPPELS